MNLLLMFEIEVARPYSWWVKERMKWRLICRGRKKSDDQWQGIGLVADETHDDENHEDDISPYGRHGVYEERGKTVGA